jgi:hypothetical protein
MINDLLDNRYLVHPLVFLRYRLKRRLLMLFSVGSVPFSLDFLVFWRKFAINNVFIGEDCYKIVKHLLMFGKSWLLE